MFFITCTPSEPKILQPSQVYNRSANTFAGTESCKSCHEKEYDLWKGSHHDLAMQIADSSTVLADFNNTSFTSNGVSSRFYRKDGKYLVETQGRDGDYHEYEVKYTFGITPLQQYIVAFPKGSYQCLQTAWDTEKGEWFDLQPNLQIDPDEWLHWTGNAMKWNTACADCHSTDLQKNLDVTTEVYSTTYKEINVGCEACHGPASQHVQFYERDLKTDPPAMYVGKNLKPQDLVDKCARCHSRRQQLTPVFDYTGDFLDHYNPNLIVTPTYELDGQILDEDYVYGSFMQSKMYHEGISCRDCHDMHSMELKMTGNQLCNSCHEPQKYDTYDHHFHEMNTDGAACINCHMTGRYYMGNDFRRDHSFRIPRPDQSVAYGTPNACNGCHTDQSAQWSADFLVEKYGPERADHFSDHLTSGYMGNKEALYHLLHGSQYPDIARASAMQYLGNQLQAEDIEKVKYFLKDTSALVRNEAIRVLQATGNPDLAQDITPLLEDDKRLVRLSAARFLLFSVFPLPEAKSFKEASEEYQEYLAYNHDTPSAHHEKAQIFQTQGKTEQAIAEYKKALEIDNHYNYSRMNLALLVYQNGQQKEAEQLYLKVIEQEPDIAYPYYMLGLFYNENNELGKSMEYLEKACEKEPPLFRAHYNFLLVLQKAQQYDRCISQAGLFLQKFPNNDQLLYLQLLAYIKSEQHDKALEVARQLVEIAPDNPQYGEVLRQLKQAGKAKADG